MIVPKKTAYNSIGARWSCGRASGFQSKGRGLKPPPPFRSFGNFVHPTLLVSFGRDSKSLMSFLACVYARGSKRSYAGKWKKYVMDSNSREGHS